MFDITKILSDMLTLLTTVFGDSWKLVNGDILTYLSDARYRLEFLGKARINGDISNEFFLSRLDDEKTELKDFLLSLSVVIKQDVQDIANQVIEIFANAILGATE